MITYVIYEKTQDSRSKRHYRPPRSGRKFPMVRGSNIIRIKTQRHAKIIKVTPQMKTMLGRIHPALFKMHIADGIKEFLYVFFLARGTLKL